MWDCFENERGAVMKVDVETMPWAQQQMLEFMRVTTEEAIEHNVWDVEHPQVWLICLEPRPLGFPEVQASQMPIPDMLWDQARPPTVLSTIAHICRSSGRKILLPEVRAKLHGIVMLSETWDLDIPETATLEEIEAARDFCDQRGIADHPWGVEAKTTFAHDIAGWDMIVGRRRGGVSVKDVVSAPGGEMPTGRIPDGLHALLDVLR